MKVHELKLAAPFCEPVARNAKTFELRYNDRDYQVGDMIRFKPVGDVSEYVEDRFRHWQYQITYLLRHEDFPDGVPEGWCAFSIKPECFS